ncbi:hypothetical protein [Streptomyces bobili]|uniref:hypothetical protein n=1 Tax=Streptomyces bobili TaxID=67280 RepID=UPI0037ABEA54
MVVVGDATEEVAAQGEQVDQDCLLCDREGGAGFRAVSLCGEALEAARRIPAAAAARLPDPRRVRSGRARATGRATLTA